MLNTFDTNWIRYEKLNEKIEFHEVPPPFHLSIDLGLLRACLRLMYQDLFKFKLWSLFSIGVDLFVQS